MKNPIYKHPWLYEWSIRILYHWHYLERYRAVAREIREGESVVDLCAGDCALYRYVLSQRNGDYTACDCNASFLHWASKQGITTCCVDLLDEAIPSADVLVMMGSLCQFYPNQVPLIEKMKKAAGRCVLLSEPVRNMAQSRFSVFRMGSRWLSSVDQEIFTFRYDETIFVNELRKHDFQEFKKIPGGRDCIAIYTKY